MIQPGSRQSRIAHPRVLRNEELPVGVLQTTLVDPERHHLEVGTAGLLRMGDFGKAPSLAQIPMLHVWSKGCEIPIGTTFQLQIPANNVLPPFSHETVRRSGPGPFERNITTRSQVPCLVGGSQFAPVDGCEIPRGTTLVKSPNVNTNGFNHGFKVVRNGSMGGGLTNRVVLPTFTRAGLTCPTREQSNGL